MMAMRYKYGFRGEVVIPDRWNRIEASYIKGSEMADIVKEVVRSFEEAKVMSIKIAEEDARLWELIPPDVKLDMWAQKLWQDIRGYGVYN
jgi:hypothetical protein